MQKKPCKKKEFFPAFDLRSKDFANATPFTPAGLIPFNEENIWIKTQ
jgi:hypothetical protein